MQPRAGVAASRRAGGPQALCRHTFRRRSLLLLPPPPLAALRLAAASRRARDCGRSATAGRRPAGRPLGHDARAGASSARRAGERAPLAARTLEAPRAAATSAVAAATPAAAEPTSPRTPSRPPHRAGSDRETAKSGQHPSGLSNLLLPKKESQGKGTASQRVRAHHVKRPRRASTELACRRPAAPRRCSRVRGETLKLSLQTQREPAAQTQHSARYWPPTALAGKAW